MTALIFDTETTGVETPDIVSAAWIEVFSPENLTPISSFHEFFRPSKPISLGALATHHIMDEDLLDRPASSTFKLPEGTRYLIGHNIDFDWGAVGAPDVRRICTLAFARQLWPDLEKHTQSALLYHFERESARETLKNAHAADADVAICSTILGHIQQEVRATNWEHMWELCEVARVPTRMWMGKHYGDPMQMVPRQYKNWALNNTDPNPYQRKALMQ